MQFLVHHLELRTDAEYDFHALFLRHLVVRKARHADVVHNLHAVHDQFPVNPVPLRGEGDGQCIGTVTAYLSGKVPHVVRQFRYFVVETVYLRRIAYNRPERVQIVVELPLQVGRGFHFLFRPQVSGGLQQHDLLLVLQLLFRLVGIEQDHPGKHGVVLRPYLADTDAQQKDSYPNRPFHRSPNFIAQGRQPCANGTWPSVPPPRCCGRASRPSRCSTHH